MRETLRLGAPIAAELTDDAIAMLGALHAELDAASVYRGSIEHAAALANLDHRRAAAALALLRQRRLVRHDPARAADA